MALTGKYDENIYFNLLDYDQSGYITQFGHVLPNANYIVNKRNLTRHLFDYVIRGSGYIMYGDKRYTVRAGDLVYMRKGVRVDYGATRMTHTRSSGSARTDRSSIRSRAVTRGAD